MTNSITPSTHTREITRRALNGWPMLASISLSSSAVSSIFICGIAKPPG